MTDDIEPIDRATFEARAIDLGIQHPVKDARCHGEYLAYSDTGKLYIDSPYDRLMVARGKQLAAEGYTPPAPKHGPGYAPGLPGQIFGGPSADRADECHYCGLDPDTCDCR